MNNNKGFTLIELLAVIVILAIIALIATPITMNVVADAKQSGAISETKIIAQSVENYCKTEYYKKSINPSYVVVCNASEGSTKTLTAEEIANMVDIKEGTTVSITVNDKGTITDGYVTTNGYQVSATTFEATPEGEEEVPCFTFNASTHTITSYNASCGTEVIIPTQIDGVTVTAIGANAFQNKGLTSLTIPNGIVEIGDYAFANNLFTTLSTPNSLTKYGVGSFSYNNLQQVYLGAPTIFCCSCVTIDENAFRYNRIPQGNAILWVRTSIGSAATIGANAFANNGIGGQTTINLSWDTSGGSVPEKC